MQQQGTVLLISLLLLYSAEEALPQACDVTTYSNSTACTFCQDLDGLQETYRVFTDDNVRARWTFNASSSKWTSYLAAPNGGVYGYEATELPQLSECVATAANNPPTQCVLCKYHNDKHFTCAGSEVDLPPVSSFQRSASYLPMFGPCFDGTPSKPARCVQHVPFYPPSYVGYYYYPLQRPVPNDDLPFQPADGQVAPVHTYLQPGEATASGTGKTGLTPQKSPSWYGVGRDAVLDSVRTTKVINRTTNAVDAVRTEELIRDYNGTGWVMWAQHFCMPGCHRDSSFGSGRVLEGEPQKSPEWSFLQRFLDPGGTNHFYKCTPCPSGYVGYHWDEWDDQGGEPTDSRLNFFGETCYPWFGRLPAVAPNTDPATVGLHSKNFNYSVRSFDPHYAYPTDIYTYASAVCPPDTFNRMCAHTLRYFLWKADDTYGETAASRAAYASRFACTPCPAGWSTGNRSGAWFCLPPAGMYFPFTGDALEKSGGVNGTFWANRDIVQTEPECGWLPAHCFQCRDQQRFPNTLGLTPVEFNEQVLFRSILYTEACPSNYYCPTAYARVACPAAFPYSPASSSQLSQCACARGTYRSGGACAPCSDWSTCPLGYYRPDTCQTTDGLTFDPPCRPCNNLPAAYATVLNGSAAPNSTFGACSFECLSGYVMQVVYDSALPLTSTWSCVKPQPVRSASGAYLYSPAAAKFKDAFVARATNGLQVQKRLTDALWSCDATTCRPYSVNCLGREGCTGDDALCYNNRTDTGPDWYSVFSDAQCSPCPHGALPANAVRLNNAGDVTLGMQAACVDVVQCRNSSLYFNATSWSCDSCAARAALVCPAPTWQLRGQGCAGQYTPFNRLNPASDCFKCDLQVSALQSGYFIDTNRLGGCAVAQCTAEPAIVGQHYLTATCGGYQDNVWVQCRDISSCGAGTFATPCTLAHDLQCKNCSLPPAGSYISALGKCGVYSDAVFEPCPEGFFCVGSTTAPPTPCGGGKTSDKGAVDSSRCYCPLGYSTSADGALCVPMQCDQNQSHAGPGTSYVAPYLPGPQHFRTPFYLSLDRTSTPPRSVCVPCGTGGAYARGYGLGFSSCVCPADMFSQTVLVNASAYGGQSYLACSSCGTPGTCAGDKALGPSICWRGDTVAQASCECQSPPFGAVSNSQTCAVSCQAGFLPQTWASAQGTYTGANVTGSALHVRYANSKDGWQRFAYDKYESRRITAFAVTYYEQDVGQYRDNEAQFAVWAVFELGWVFMAEVPVRRPSVVAEQVSPFAYTYQYSLQDDPYTHNSWTLAAQLADSSSEQYGTIVGLCVTPWARNALSTTWARQPSVQVGAVMFWRGSARYDPRLVLHVVPFTPGLSGVWGSATQTFTLIQTANVSFVAVASARAVPGVSKDLGNVFYVAYNVGNHTCGGVKLVAPSAGTTSPYHSPNDVFDVCKNAYGAISAFGVAPAVAGSGVVSIYIAYEGSSKLWVITPAQDTAGNIRFPSNVANEQAFFAFDPTRVAGSPILQGRVQHLFTTNGPVVIAGVRRHGGACAAGYDGCIVAADPMQRTFTEIEGMPWGTAPSQVPVAEDGIPPLSAAGVATSSSSAVVVAPFKDGLFAIDVGMCAPFTTGIPQYFDGGALSADGARGQRCQPHLCMRQQVCRDNAHPKGDGTCICNAGYYDVSAGATTGGTSALTCQPCADRTTYCPGTNAREMCPSNRVVPANAVSLPTSQSDCLCEQGLYWDTFDTQPKCIDCPKGAWCPDLWSIVQCPGRSDPTAGSAKKLYPTTCTCRPGFTGPSCAPCPAGKFCPSSKTAVAYNSAAHFNVSRTSAAVAYTAEGARTVALAALLAFFATCDNVHISNCPAYLTSADEMQARTYIALTASRNLTSAYLTVMVQMDSAADELRIHGWPAALVAAGRCEAPSPEFVAAGVCIAGLLTAMGPIVESVARNPPTLCLANKVPKTTGDDCECAPGFTPSSADASQCVACPANTYKPLAGAAACTKCSVGLTSQSGAAECQAVTTPAPTGSGGTNGGLSNVVIIGIAAGGGALLVVAGVMFAIYG